MQLNLYSIAYPVTSLGPGHRVVLWVAGCSKRCPGCITPQLLTADSGRLVDTSTIAARILALPMPLAGLTVSGGEPTDQAAPLVELIGSLRRERPTWSFISYSGYTLEEIRADPAGRALLLPQLDVLVDGAYMREIAPTHPLAGSGNQVVHALTERGVSTKQAMDAGTGPAFNLGLGRTHDILIGVSTSSQRAAAHRALALTRHRNGREAVES